VAFNDPFGVMTGYSVQNKSNSPTAYSGMLFYDQNGALGQFQGFNNATHEYRINNIAAGGSINFMIGSSSKFLVANNGTIGVGTTGTANLTVKANPSFTATRTVSTTAGSRTLTGVGTRVLTELTVGDRVTISGSTSAVFAITSDTVATIGNLGSTVSGAAMTVLPAMFRVQSPTGGLSFQVNDAGNISIGGALASGAPKVYITDTNRFAGTSTAASIANGNISIITNTPQAACAGGVLALGGFVGTVVSSFAGIRGAKENGTDGDLAGYMGLFTTDASGTFAERMRVTSAG